LAKTSTSSAETDLELAARLRLAITRTARRLRQQAGADLGPSQAAALATIERHGPLPPSELADLERIQRPTVTRIVARLTEAGLVERTADPEDGRSSLVSITREGRDLLGALRSRKTAYLAEHLGRLGSDDVKALQRAAEVLERMLERDAEPE
jgi:DNA-binding MarR family transcriptional regulator